MSGPESTCWTEVRGAAAGDGAARDAFARRYAPVVRAYLAARWRGSPLSAEVDDAAQEVFVRLFQPGGALDRLDPERPGGFRPFLYGVVRNVALRAEERRALRREHPAGGDDLDRRAADESGLSTLFDRAWARAIVREAVTRQEEAAAAEGPAAVRRAELLRLRFQEGLPIREVAARWGADAAALHREYARARREFRAALLAVVAFHHPGPPDEVERECANLLSLLGEK